VKDFKLFELKDGPKKSWNLSLTSLAFCPKIFENLLYFDSPLSSTYSFSYSGHTDIVPVEAAMVRTQNFQEFFMINL